MTKPTVIVSDIHLGAAAAREAEFLDFLSRWRGRAELILINGDLFDFWFEYRTVIPSQHFRVLRVLAELRDSGVQLMLIGGNHDFWGGRFLSEEIGMRLADGPIELDLGGRRALVAHGDGLGPGDHGYKLLKRTLRSLPLRGMMRMTHPDLADRIVQRISRTGGHGPEDASRSKARAQILEGVAASELESRADIDVVVYGHCHVPLLREFGTGRYYVNSGDWIAHRTYTTVTPDELSQREWDGGDP